VQDRDLPEGWFEAEAFVLNPRDGRIYLKIDAAGNYACLTRAPSRIEEVKGKNGGRYLAIQLPDDAKPPCPPAPNWPPVCDPALR